MKALEYRIEFLTPAFLGNAEQRGQWRTPPFKALLRQWWRVARFARHGGYPCGGDQVSRMREKEGEIFGTASGAGESSESRMSRVRIRLSDRQSDGKGAWKEGRLTRRNWNVPKSGQPDLMLYIGYGLLKSADKMSRESAINVRECKTLKIAAPDCELKDIRLTLALIDRFGTIGGRSRNGWGSIALKDVNGDTANLSELPSSIIRPWKQALALEWPHAIGSDEKDALIWQTRQAYGGWQDLMKDFGRIRKGIRNIHKTPKGDDRVPNTIRFKARRDTEQPGKLRGIIFHVPCSRQDKRYLNPGENKLERIHQYLDNDSNTKRVDLQRERSK